VGTFQSKQKERTLLKMIIEKMTRQTPTVVRESMEALEVKSPEGLKKPKAGESLGPFADEGRGGLLQVKTPL